MLFNFDTTLSSSSLTISQTNVSVKRNSCRADKNIAIFNKVQKKLHLINCSNQKSLEKVC
jgi:hypothetical protein